MPHRCFVQGCRGNYDNGPHVSVYSFPTDEEMKSKWVAAISRGNQKITKASKVCERHFNSSDIETETGSIDPKTGKLIIAKLSRTRLRKGAIPKLFLQCPSSLSINFHEVDFSREKSMRMKHLQKKRAIQASLNAKENLNKKKEETDLLSNVVQEASRTEQKLNSVHQISSIAKSSVESSRKIITVLNNHITMPLTCNTDDTLPMIPNVNSVQIDSSHGKSSIKVEQEDISSASNKRKMFEELELGDILMDQIEIKKEVNDDDEYENKSSTVISDKIITKTAVDESTVSQEQIIFNCTIIKEEICDSEFNFSETMEL